MTVFWFTLALAYIFSLLSRYFSKPVSIGPTYIQPSVFPAFITMAVLALVAGLRNNIGDTVYYVHSYVTGIYTWETLDFNGDFGFIILQMILQSISRDPQIMIFVTALITNVLIVAVIYRYSRIVELSIFIYITSGMYLTSMNGIRQYLAAAIIFTSTKYLLNGDWKKYVLIVLLASTIHKSALILLPIYFVVRKKAWTKQTVLLVAVAVVIVIGFNQFMGALFSVIGDSQYGQYQNFSEGGANILRVVVALIPLVIAFLGRDKLRVLFPNIDYIVNLNLINCVFMIISTQNWIFARFSIYFGLYQLILLSWVIKVFREKDQKLMYYGILVCYFIFYFYECVIIFGTQYGSNFIK
ncbi:EpsG family protein [Paenibacillus mendelii]|uniref:EpsG family protein n=1 Tax=Paenibacillus mendelii TaxID=206163 RepID=A0ABV6JJS6_9BACL|nr:EpsG family protein [Paenibacillus mendelii]MCQ6558986.1 EpsG family protein [Paenibacillus mendelii]